MALTACLQNAVDVGTVKLGNNLFFVKNYQSEGDLSYSNCEPEKYEENHFTNSFKTF